MMEEKLYKNREWMYEHYVEMEESTYAIAREAGCSQFTILYWLHKFDIPVRTSGEGIFLARRNYLDISSGLLDLLEGELLGDGCIKMSSSRSARYTHGSKYKEYVVWLSKILADLGLEQSGKICHNFSGFSPRGVYQHNSRSYPELVPLRQQWYPNGKKIVPKDLILTPTICRQWYLGDGSLGDSTKRRPDISFSTDDFDKPSIDHLLKELRGKGFKVNHWPASNKIGMSVESVRDFLNWIGPCPIDCYSYKWSYQDNRKSTAL